MQLTTVRFLGTFLADPLEVPALGHLGVLVEPASVVAKAWDHIERIGARSPAWTPRSVLVTRAGPIGLLAALLGTQKGYDVHVADRVTDGPKPGLVTDLGARHHTAPDAPHRRRSAAISGVRFNAGSGPIVSPLPPNAAAIAARSHRCRRPP